MATQARTTDLSAAIPTATSRVEWIDATRGLAILLVVFGHAAGGLIDASGPVTLPALRYLFVAIYTFHMPLFFFMSGLFVEQRLASGIRSFIGRLIPTIVYPYFLWSIVQFSVIFAMGSLVNHPATNFWGTVLALPWKPVSQFWFLHALFLIHLLGIVALQIGGRRAVLGAAILAKLFVMFVHTTPAISLAASNAPYYALGVLFGWREASALIARASTEARCVIIAAAIALITVLVWNADVIQPYINVETANSPGLAKLAWIPAMLPATLLGGTALALVADSLSRRPGPVFDFFKFLGKMTMPIFLLHVLFVAGLRILLAKLFGFGGVAVLPLLIAVSITGSILVRRAADRLGLTRVLALR